MDLCHGAGGRSRPIVRALSAAIAVVLFLTLGTPWAARAQQMDEHAEAVGETLGDATELGAASEIADAVGAELPPETVEALGEAALDPGAVEAMEQAAEQALAEGDLVPLSLPGGESRSAVSPQAISLPSAEGSIEGMGESFSPVLSSGTGTFSVPIAVPNGRAGVQPSFALSYGTSAGNGNVGFGWSIGAPFIARQTDRGLPRYVNRPRWHAEEDRFIYNGGQELVPVDNAEIATVDGYGAGALPDGVGDSWQQYRARVEGGFMRFFRSPNADRWVVQSKDGTRFDFGVVDDGPSGITTESLAALQTESDDGSGPVYSWLLTRMSDAHGSTVYYRYVAHQGDRYLSEVVYMSPASCANEIPSAARACSAALSQYGARVGFVYEGRSDVFTSYASGWRVATALRLKRVEVTAASDAPGQRWLVRRYHLGYDPASYHSLLTSVQVEGRPSVPHATVAATVSQLLTEESLNDAIRGELLPPMTFNYTAQPTGAGSVPGFGGVSGTPIDVAFSPPHSVDEERADLFDVNSDGLPDLVVTDPARYRTEDDQPAAGVFFNGFEDATARPAGAAATFSDAIPLALPSGLASVMSLSNPNIVPMDIDGDGRSDLLHMPRARSYGWFSPTRGPDDGSVSPAEQGWRFSYAEIQLPPSDTDPRIDLGRDSAHLQILDVNNDHLIDVVRTTGAVMQTWLNLGWLPEGDGRFGSYSWTGSSWSLSTQPLESCLLHDGLPLDFEDPEVRLADMNGDGLQDIAKVRPGRIIWWPGRGGGVFGEGTRTCAPGSGADREIRVASAPRELNLELSNVHLEDVNADGAADVVQVRFDAIDVWFSRAGESFTERFIVHGTPAAPDYLPRIRFADIDGSGTTDVVYGNAHDWKYVDLMGGVRPRLLESVGNGLGALTTLAYEPSSIDYMQDLADADSCTTSSCETFSWSFVDTTLGCPSAYASDAADTQCYVSGGSPVITTVVRSVTTTDRFDEVSGPENVMQTVYAYHDGYYEGIEQEFRGFGVADAIAIGDAAHPTSTTRTYFYQGRRPGDIARDRLADNPRECLKARAYLTETFDDDGRYLSSTHSSYVARRLLAGLDGRSLFYAYVSQTDDVRYSHIAYDLGTDTIDELPTVVWQRLDGLGAVVVEDEPGDVPEADPSYTMPVRAEIYAHLRTTTDEVDNVGNVLQQTAHGRITGEGGETPSEAIVTHTTPMLCDDAAWIWRTERTFIDGHGTSVPLGDTSNEYDETTCALRYSVQQANIPSGTPEYEFGALEQIDQDIVSSTEVDEWGNVTKTCAGADLRTDDYEECLRFAEVVYDEEYAQQPVTERIAVDKTESPFRTLDTDATWDRGLGVLTSAEDPNDKVTEVGYDGLGRLTFVRQPTVAGCTGSTRNPQVRFEYEVAPGGQPVSVVRTTQHIHCTSTAAGNLIQTRSYVDGLGRPRASVMRHEQSSLFWELTGHTRFSARGTPILQLNASVLALGADPTPVSVVAEPAGVPAVITMYDAFGRVVLTMDQDEFVTQTDYGALSTTTSDPLDLDSGSDFAGTPTTTRVDGHGRAIDQVLWNVHPENGNEYHRLFTTYRADGVVLALTRAQTEAATGSTVYDDRETTRTFVYDTAGRRLGSTDPDTDSSDEGATADDGTWRYLFNRVGDLVAVRDPRGCGQDFFYDQGGRLIGELYVSCGESQESGDEPDVDLPSTAIALDELDDSVEVDVRYYFEDIPPWEDDMGGTRPSSVDLGRLVGVSDRAQRTTYAYDEHGNTKYCARQVALVPVEDSDIATTISDDFPGVIDTEDITPATRAFDIAHTYEMEFTFDHQNRPLEAEYPADPDFAGSGAHEVRGRLTYQVRGMVRVIEARIAGSWYHIQRNQTYHEERVPRLTYLGHSDLDYRIFDDVDFERRIPIRRQLIRARSTGAAQGELGYFTEPFDQVYEWDGARNLVVVRDHVAWADFIDGHRPIWIDIEHDGLYRVVGADYRYRNSSGTLVSSDTYSDWRDERTTGNDDMGTHEDADPMRERPAPSLAADPDNRVEELDWRYDWLANMTSWTDDAPAFYERSLGAISNGFDDTVSRRPSALYLATNLDDEEPESYSATEDRGGWVEVEYGVSGNVVSVTAHGQCHDFDNDDRCYDDPGATVGDHDEGRRAWLRGHCTCIAEQHYQYRWDELNRLAEARRYDRDGSGDWDLAVRQRYRYDTGNQRIVKETLDDLVTGEVDRYALYVYPGDYERRGLELNTVDDRYDASSFVPTEATYLIGGAKLTWQDDATTTYKSYDIDPEVRLTYAVSDLIGSTSAVVDLWSGEVLALSTHYPNGAQETHWTQRETSLPVETAGFTGKEADDEVGVVYFGERYLIPRIARWASPDPLHVHVVGGGETLNSYHYVGGNMLQARDAIGLDLNFAVSSNEANRETRQLLRQAAFHMTSRMQTLLRRDWGIETTRTHDAQSITVALNGGGGDGHDAASRIKREAASRATTRGLTGEAHAEYVQSVMSRWTAGRERLLRVVGGTDRDMRLTTGHGRSALHWAQFVPHRNVALAESERFGYYEVNSFSWYVRDSNGRFVRSMAASDEASYRQFEPDVILGLHEPSHQLGCIGGSDGCKDPHSLRRREDTTVQTVNDVTADVLPNTAPRNRYEFDHAGTVPTGADGMGFVIPASQEESKRGERE